MGRKKLLTKKELFDATGELLRTEGIHGLHFKKLADELQVGRSTLYEYYRSKEDLLVAYLKEIMKEMNERIEQIPKDKRVNEKLKEFLFILLNHDEIHQVERMIRDIQTSDQELAAFYLKELSKEHQKTYSILIKWIETAKREKIWGDDVDSQLIADIIFHAILFPYKKSVGTEQMTRQLFQLLENGLLNTEKK
ncbi:TetR/AcrR family transcriptional regulator [Halobacillus sp. Marseille-Q1614]|uniref:TetR/AcrR family transcriptional regulator n=1 Tax=Halobacillus sp. Marseille-Q1614 TaxID=2709134 RepID=UPI0015711250|nr:TetR/AcrR family transcriptional regulator [Halobacillus sp. Marseille-Q1614]